MAMQTNNTSNLLPPLDGLADKLAAVNARAWLLGCGVGCETGLSALYAILAIWDGNARWLAIPALAVSLVHATIIAKLWQNRNDVLRRTAVIASMIASAVLLFVLAVLIGNNGLPTSPLFAFALIHLIFAFSHPLLFVTNTKPA